jgi:hypothetical protein
MGIISGFGVKFYGIEFIYFSAQLSSVSWIVIGSILLCLIVVLGFYIFKQFKDDDKCSEAEDINLGNKKGFIRRNINK